jgi:Txe/YoeB family toxin of Txe-Axe toxin-antitoxin module
MISKCRTKGEGWLNIYRLISAPFITQTSLHATEQEAKAQGAWCDRIDNDHRLIDTIRISWDEEAL